MDKTKKITDIPEWFSGSRLNYAENLLRYKDSKTAIIECGVCVFVCVHSFDLIYLCYLGEGHLPREISFQELHIRVGEIAAALKSFGVKQGDRIAGKKWLYIFLCCIISTCSGYLPNCALAVEAMLATSSLGAIWCSTSPDFGVSVSQNVCQAL